MDIVVSSVCSEFKKYGYLIRGNASTYQDMYMIVRALPFQLNRLKNMTIFSLLIVRYDIPCSRYIDTYANRVSIIFFLSL